MFGHKNRFPQVFFTGKMVIDSPHGNSSAIYNLAHGSGMVSLLDEQLVSRVNNPGAGCVTFTDRFIIHDHPWLNKSERSLLFSHKSSPNATI
jgi:hypothetical protein